MKRRPYQSIAGVTLLVGTGPEAIERLTSARVAILLGEVGKGRGLCTSRTQASPKRTLLTEVERHSQHGGANHCAPSPAESRTIIAESSHRCTSPSHSHRSSDPASCGIRPGTNLENDER